MCGETSTYQTCHSDIGLPFVKASCMQWKSMWNETIISLWIDFDRFSRPSIWVSSCTSHNIWTASSAIWWANNSSKSHGRATYAIITWLKDPSMSSHFLSGISKGFAHSESNHLLESTCLLTRVSKNLDCLRTCQWSNLEHKDRLEGEDHIWYMLMTIAMYHCHGFVALISN